MYKRIKEFAEATVRVASREELPFAEHPEEGPKLFKTRCTLVYEGGIEGEAILEELTVQFGKRSAVMSGMQYLKVRIGELNGRFATYHEGKIRDGVLTHSQIVVPGSASGKLKGLRGRIKIHSPAAEILPVTFRYYFL